MDIGPWYEGTYPGFTPGYVYANYGVNPASCYSAIYPHDWWNHGNAASGQLRKALDWPPSANVVHQATIFPPKWGLPYYSSLEQNVYFTHR